MWKREDRQRWERKHLSPRACITTRGRMYQERECDYRTPFQRDRDRIIHCKAFRRLMHKTQVFIAPEGDHYRTRLTHTLEVSQIARTAARALGLNEDLTEAIALGHDLGHTPFGHAGEATLNDLVPGGFSHNQQSLRVVDVLEEKDPAYRGLNLTWEVRDGILNHTGPQMPATLEGQIVKLSDRIAYINHDIDDALRAGLITLEQLPSPALEVLGRDHSQRIDRMIRDLVEYSQDRGYIAMSPPIWEATNLLRDFLFAHVYVGSAAKQEESKVRDTLSRLYVFYVENPQELPEYIQAVPVEPGRDRAVDYIAGMTDRFAMADYVEKFLPQGWRR